MAPSPIATALVATAAMLVLAPTAVLPSALTRALLPIAPETFEKMSRRHTFRNIKRGTKVFFDVERRSSQSHF